MDNTEHIIPLITELLSETLLGIDGLKIILTSRVPLKNNIVPDMKIEPMGLLEGIRCFIVVQKNKNYLFKLPSQIRVVLARLIQQLDCLPLAIELAAARIELFDVGGIEQRLSNRFELLRGRLRNTKMPALQGALDWSWNLLSDFSQAILVQCSTFRGGFDLNAVGGNIGRIKFENAPAIFDVVEALYDDNLLLRQEQADGEVRYGMLACIREYAANQFPALSAFQCVQTVAHRHAEYFARWYKTLDSERPSNFSQSLKRELGNCIEGFHLGEAHFAFLCCQAAMKCVQMNGPMIRGVELSRQFLNRTDLTEKHRLSILLERIMILRISGMAAEAKEELRNTEAFNFASDEISLVSNVDVAGPLSNHFSEQGGISSMEIHFQLGYLERDLSNFKEALEHFELALQRAQRASLQIWESLILKAIGTTYRIGGDEARSLEYLEKKAFQLANADPYNEHKISILGELGTTYIFLHQYDLAIEHLEQTVELARSLEIEEQRGDFSDLLPMHTITSIASQNRLNWANRQYRLQER